MTEDVYLKFELENYLQPEGYVPNDRLYLDLTNATAQGYSALLFGFNNECILIGGHLNSDELHNWQISGNHRRFNSPRKAIEFYEKTVGKLDGSDK